MIVFDIETGPLSEKVVLGRNPDFKPPDRPGEFDESTVKIGALKDPEKIAAKISAARQKHEDAVADYETKTAVAKITYEKELIDRAALSPLTGRIIAIGYKSEKGKAIKIARSENCEREIVAEFWRKFESCNQQSRRIVGHNIFGFDLPFLIRRSWLLDVAIPDGVIDRDRFWNDRVFCDTMKRWQCGNYGEKFVKLETLSQATGGTGKPDGVTGAMFADLISGSAEDQKIAVDYLDNDIEMTWDVAVALGIR